LQTIKYFRPIKDDVAIFNTQQYFQFMNENFQMSLYFLSAISQSMAALFAVGGIFAIYQLQKIDNLIEHICNSYRYYLTNISKDPNMKESTMLNKDVKGDLLHTFPKDSNQPGLVDRFVQLDEAEGFLRKLRIWVWLPTILIAIPFLLSVWLLAKLSPFGLHNEMFNVLFYFVLLAVYSVTRYMYFAIRGPRQIVFNNSLVADIDDKELNNLRDQFLSEQEVKMHSQYRRLKSQYRRELEKLAKNKWACISENFW